MTLQWSIDGVWLTNLARTWFWDENRPYAKCAELLGSCIRTDDQEEKDAIIRDILECRKRFEGVNVFELTDDPGPVRLLSDKISMLEKKSRLLEIGNAIRDCAIDYVDPYSTAKSLPAARDEGVMTLDACVAWFLYPDWDMARVMRGELDATRLPAAEEPTRGGLWLLDEPKTILAALEASEADAGSDAFWDAIYDITKDRPGFERRNMYYEACRKLPGDARDGKKRTFAEGAYKGYGSDDPRPDPELPGWSGLVSPEGDFYPCDFGAHEATAWRLVESGIADIGREPDFAKMHDAALGILIEEFGWIACRFLPTRGHYVIYKGEDDPASRWKPTDEQKKIVWELAARHADSRAVPGIFF